MCLAQGYNALTMVRLEQADLMSRVKHSITEPLRSSLKRDIYKNRTCVYIATAACVMVCETISAYQLTDSRPLSMWSLIIFYELIFCGNLTYRWRLFGRVLGLHVQGSILLYSRAAFRLHGLIRLCISDSRLYKNCI